MKNNARFYTKATNKNNKQYTNLFIEVDLGNNDVVVLQVKQAFYNSKLQYKLVKRLPTYEGK